MMPVTLKQGEDFGHEVQALSNLVKASIEARKFLKAPHQPITLLADGAIQVSYEPARRKGTK